MTYNRGMDDYGVAQPRLPWPLPHSKALRLKELEEELRLMKDELTNLGAQLQMALDNSRLELQRLRIVL